MLHPMSTLPIKQHRTLGSGNPRTAGGHGRISPIDFPPGPARSSQATPSLPLIRGTKTMSWLEGTAKFGKRSTGVTIGARSSLTPACGKCGGYVDRLFELGPARTY